MRELFRGDEPDRVTTGPAVDMQTLDGHGGWARSH